MCSTVGNTISKFGNGLFAGFDVPYIQGICRYCFNKGISETVPTGSIIMMNEDCLILQEVNMIIKEISFFCHDSP
jgi:hypothetical protein